MPFGLKNAGATYQRAMTTLFHDMMHKEIEVYVDDMIAKSRSEVEAKLTDAEWVQSRYDQLNLIEEKRLTAMCHGQLYQQRMKKAFDKKVKPRVF